MRMSYPFRLFPALFLPLLLTNLTFSYSLQSSPISLAISNALSTYCYLLDSKNFTGLSAVFVGDVVATFPEPLGVMHGTDALAAGLNQSLFGLESQHLLGSISIDVHEGGQTVRSKS